MINEQFTLTVRSEDLREIFRDRLNYRFFSVDAYPAILKAALFLVLAIICVYKTISDDAFFFLSLCFIGGFGYQAIQLLDRYWRFKKGSKDIETWIESLKQYKSHRLMFEDRSFKYIRDADIFVYDINALKKTYRNNTYFYINTENDMDLILPEKSFQPGEFEKFIECFEARLKLAELVV